MSKPDEEPLRGEAAWRAEKKAIAARNEAAYARGRTERAAREGARASRRREQDRRLDAGPPQQRAR
jgi:hypothetical protein